MKRQQQWPSGNSTKKNLRKNFDVFPFKFKDST